MPRGTPPVKEPSCFLGLADHNTAKLCGKANFLDASGILISERLKRTSIALPVRNMATHHRLKLSVPETKEYN